MHQIIASILDSALAAGAFPGAVCHLSRRGEVVFHGASGNLGVEAPFLRPATVETTYDLASVSKIYTLCAALRTLRDAKIPLDTPLQQFFRSFDARITLQLLMAHASGISFAVQKLDGIAADNWMRKVAEAPLQSAPATEVLYSCTNFWLLSRVIEKISGTSLDSLIETQILRPLQLENTGFEPGNGENIAPTERIGGTKEDLEAAFFHGVVHDEAARSWRTQTGTCAGNAGVFATAADVAGFARLWTQQGAGVLHPADAALAFAPLFPEKTYFRGTGFQIDAAFYMSESAPSPSAGHTGFTGPSLVLTPQDDVLVILNNRVHPTRNGPERMPFHRQIAAQFFDLAPE